MSRTSQSNINKRGVTFKAGLLVDRQMSEYSKALYSLDQVHIANRWTIKKTTQLFAFLSRKDVVLHHQ